MTRPTVVIHERLGTWSRQLRPRLASWPIRWAETRSGPELEAAVAGPGRPIVVLDLGNRPRAGLEDLERALLAAPDALALVLDPLAHEGVPSVARELGAALVMTGVITPPSVAGLLERWLRLARRRADADGWSGDPGPEPSPWDRGGPAPPRGVTDAHRIVYDE
jgi:hypothetical protein